MCARRYDTFHEMIAIDELVRAGAGLTWALTGGLGIGLPPIRMFGMPKDPAKADRIIRCGCAADGYRFFVYILRLYETF